LIFKTFFFLNKKFKNNNSSFSSATKGCVLAATLFLLEGKGFIVIPRDILFLSIALMFAYVKVTSIFFKSFDPLIPFENLTSAFLFGGIFDALRKANSTTGNQNNSTTPATSATAATAGATTSSSKLNSPSTDIDSKKVN
jgi:hypothetical protein